MTTLRAATESCIRDFAVVCHELKQHAYLDTSWCEDVQEAFGRFRVWTGNLGALAKGHSALDWRLRDADVMRSTVLSLLVELQNLLELASDLVRDGTSEVFLGAETYDHGDVPDDISLPSDDEQDVISQPVDGLSLVAPRILDLVKDLYKLSFRIRNSTSKPARAIHYKEIDASSGLDIFGDCFAALDRNHILELFRSLRHGHPSLTEEDNGLVQRLAKANTVRRRQFRYWQKHAQKLATTEVPGIVVPTVAALEYREEPVQLHATPKPATNTQMSRSHHGKTIFTTTEATFFDPKLDLTTFETQSVVSSATTARDLEGKPADLPPPPAAALNGQDFVCPYCYVLCPSKHGRGRAWRTHILRDLSPYVCTYYSCATPERFYASRREWLEHEDLQHRTVWICRFHPLLQFPNQESLERHLLREVHQGMTGHSIRDYASISHLAADDSRPKCPICLETTSFISHLPAHLAQHMERIATFSLPRMIDDDEQASTLSHKAVLRSRIGSSLDSDMNSSEGFVAPWLDEADNYGQRESISAWLAPDAFSKPPGREPFSVDATLWQGFITGSAFKAWSIGDPLWRIYCCGSHKGRLSVFSSSVLAELKGSLPNDNTVIALFMPDMPTQTDPAHAFLASLLGQLLTRVPTADIPQVILDGLNTTNPPLPSVNVIKEALGQLLRSFKRVYLILDNLGDYWDQGALPLWTVIMAPRFANLRLLLTMQTFQNPSMTTSCTVCGKEELLVYWHCTTCKGGNFDACSTCHERRLSCQNPSHRCVLTDVQKEKAVVDVDSFYPHAIPDIDFARRIDLKLLTINQRNQSRAEAGGLLMTQYDSIFDDISSNPHERLIIKALDIVYHALRTLTVDEFLAAISLSQDLSVSDISQIITWTGGLMKVSMDAGGVFCVQLFDISLTEHLQRKKDKLFALGHTTLAKACLQVLSTQASPTELIPTGKTKPLGSSLYDYAVCTWGSHLRACPPSPILEDMALRYLRDDEKLNLGTLTAYTVQPEAMAYGFDTGDGLAAVHVCSLFGLTSLLQRLPTTELDRPARGTGRTPLAYACRMGHVDTVMFLLESGANLGSRSADGLIVNAGSGSALGRASTHGHVKIVQLLLDAGADVNSQDSAAENSGETPLMSASEMGHTDIAKSLVEHGADLNAQDCVARSFGETPLISASRMGHASIVKLLLESGADPNLKTAVGSTALHEAIKSGVVPVVEVLLRWPDVKLTSITSREGEIVSLLTSLFQLRSLDILTLALTRDDLDINEKDQNGRTALWWLLSASHDEYDSDFQLGAAKLIIQHPRCDANVVDLAGRTYVMRFLNARILNAELLGLLLEHSVDIDREDEDGETAIFHAVTLRYSMQMTSVLIDHGADLTVKDSRGQGLLHRLVTDLDGVQDLQHLDLLLERNPALKDSRDEDGRTALHLALILDKLDLAKELLARGTIVDLRDRSGKTPLDVACQLGHTSVVAELTENVIHRSILGTPFEDSGMAALEIVSFAHKSLRMNEFEHALIYLIEGRSLRSARHPKLIGLVEYTRSLLTLQQNRVLFAQEQVSAYFEQTRDRWFPSGQANMAFACLRVLTSEKLPTESAVDWVFSPLYRYAACEWAKHVYAYSPKLALVDDLAVRYLKDTRRLDMGNEVAFGSVGESGLDALHICSMFGLTSTILRLWAHPHGSELNINSQTNDHKRTPLVYAASMGHLDTLKLLLELGADPYLTTIEGCTALCEALKQDRRLIVAHFLDSPTLRLDTMITGNIRATALMQIQDFTSVELVRALLKRPDIDVNESDGRGFTVLSHLLMNSSKHEPAFRAEVAQLIVEAPGFDMSAVDAQGKGYAQQLLDGPDFHEELLLVLLEHGIDLGHRDHEGKNAMSYAIARHSTTSAIWLLLDHGTGTNEEGSTLRELMQLIPSYRNHGIHGVQSASHSYWT